MHVRSGRGEIAEGRCAGTVALVHAVVRGCQLGVVWHAKNVGREVREHRSAVTVDIARLLELLHTCRGGVTNLGVPAPRSSWRRRRAGANTGVPLVEQLVEAIVEERAPHLQQQLGPLG